jgi:hypothetical protein
MNSASDLARMRAVQEAHMFDECVISVYSSSSNKLNEKVAKFTDETTPTKCGFDLRSGSERYNPQGAQVVYDASIRLPVGTVVTSLDHIKFTKKAGESLAAVLEFSVVGPVQFGPTATRLLLKKVE